MTTEEILWNATFEREPDQTLKEEDVDVDYSPLFEKFGDYFKPTAI